MKNVEQIQQATKDFGDATTTSANTFATSLQTIASAHADFTKKLMQHGSEFISQLTSVKEPAKLIELQTHMKRSWRKRRESLNCMLTSSSRQRSRWKI